jgi:hypothetical protein
MFQHNDYNHLVRRSPESEDEVWFHLDGDPGNVNDPGFCPFRFSL